MVYTTQVQRKQKNNIKKNIFSCFFFRTVFNVNLNDIHSFPTDKFELLAGVLNPKWERINA